VVGLVPTTVVLVVLCTLRTGESPGVGGTEMFEETGGRSIFLETIRRSVFVETKGWSIFVGSSTTAD